MSTAKLTMIDLNLYLESVGTDLFSMMELPEGIDKDVLTNNILLRGGEFEVLYSDPEFMQKSIYVWSKKWYRTFDKWVKALAIEYNPIDNYDRHEEWSDNRDKTDSDNHDVTINSSASQSGSGNYSESSHDKTTDNETTETKVSAYDSTSYQPKEKTTTDHTQNIDHSVSGNNSNNLSQTDHTTNSGTHTGNEHEGSTHNGYIHGNIGVKTTQSMLSEEIQLAEWNLYEHITDLFLSEYVIPIYS